MLAPVAKFNFFEFEFQVGFVFAAKFVVDINDRKYRKGRSPDRYLGIIMSCLIDFINNELAVFSFADNINHSQYFT
jgi:hypothetical protein